MVGEDAGTRGRGEVEMGDAWTGDAAFVTSVHR